MRLNNAQGSLELLILIYHLFAQQDGGIEKVHKPSTNVWGERKIGGMYAYTYAHIHARTIEKPKIQNMNKNIYKK